MHIICRLVVALSLSLLILVNTAPTGSSKLRNDLREIAEQTDLLLRQDYAQFIINIAHLVVDTKVAEQAELEDCQHLIDRWGSRNASWLQDTAQYREFVDQFVSLYHKDRVDYYTHGVHADLRIKLIKLTADRLAEFETRATEMICVAKEAGYTDDSLDAKYQHFARSKQFKRFAILLCYLQGIC